MAPSVPRPMTVYDPGARWVTAMAPLIWPPMAVMKPPTSTTGVRSPLRVTSTGLAAVPGDVLTPGAAQVSRPDPQFHGDAVVGVVRDRVQSVPSLPRTVTVS